MSKNGHVSRLNTFMDDHRMWQLVAPWRYSCHVGNLGKEWISMDFLHVQRQCSCWWQLLYHPSKTQCFPIFPAPEMSCNILRSCLWYEVWPRRLPCLARCHQRSWESPSWRSCWSGRCCSADGRTQKTILTSVEIVRNSWTSLKIVEMKLKLLAAWLPGWRTFQISRLQDFNVSLFHPGSFPGERRSSKPWFSGERRVRGASKHVPRRQEFAVCLEFASSLPEKWLETSQS